MWCVSRWDTHRWDWYQIYIPIECADKTVHVLDLYYTKKEENYKHKSKKCEHENDEYNKMIDNIYISQIERKCQMESTTKHNTKIGYIIKVLFCLFCISFFIFTITKNYIYSIPLIILFFTIIFIAGFLKDICGRTTWDEERETREINKTYEKRGQY